MTKEGLVKITAEIPRELWKRVRAVALYEDRKAREILVEALTGYANGAVRGWKNDPTFDAEGNVLPPVRNKGRKGKGSAADYVLLTAEGKPFPISTIDRTFARARFRGRKGKGK